MTKNNFQLKQTFCGILFCFLFTGISSAQQAVVNATIDSTSILIGEQTLVHVEVTTDKNKHIVFPIFPDTIMSGIEVVGMPKADTTDMGNNRIQIRQDYLITSFDSALYLLPPFKIVDGVDTTYSKSLGLKVSTIPVDVESKKIYDIKDVIEPPFVWKDYLWILWVLLGFIAVAIIIIVIFNKLKGRPNSIVIKKKEPELPAHIKALKELDEIKAQKLWQQGKSKEYHSQLSDTLRKYIEHRFNTTAMEMTSGEILSKIQHLSDADSVYDNLKQILQLADFVKFAKYNPLPDENQLSLLNAYLFVNQTKKEAITENQNSSDADKAANEHKSE